VGPELAGGELLAYAACVLGTFSYAFVGVITRRLSASETPLALLFYPCFVMVVLTLPFAPFAWATPAPRDLAILAAAGLLWPVAHALFAAALKRSTIARLAPFEYSSIVWVVAVDWFVFAIAPAVTTLAGSAVIIVACLLLVERAPAKQEAGA
jgi:drug/metabolite transporter (DMT)-like permease